MNLSCPRLGKMFRGCRWEGRYDVQRPNDDPVGMFVNYTGAAAVERAKLEVHRTTYVRDVCRTCGAVRERLA